MLGTLGLDTAVEVGCHQRGVQAQSFPSTLCPCCFEVAQEYTLGCECTSVGDAQLSIHSNPQVLLVGATLNEFLSQSAIMSGISLMQDFALGLVQLYQILVGPFHKLGPPGCHPVLLLCQLHHFAWCHLQTC